MVNQSVDGIKWQVKELLADISGQLRPATRVAVTEGVVDTGDDAGLSNNPLVSLGPDEASLPEASLEFVAGVKQPTRWPMKCALALVGRSWDCKVRLGGSTVGRFHCSLVRTPFGIWVIDLLSEGGIQLNGRRVRCSRLKEGDNLQVGKFIYRFLFDTANGDQWVWVNGEWERPEPSRDGVPWKDVKRSS